VQEAWERAPDAATRWQQLRKAIGDALEQAAKLPPKTRAALQSFIPAVVFTYTYPRVAMPAAPSLSFWVRTPFSVHPDTRRVRVPLVPATVDGLNPDELLPTVATLASSIGAAVLAPFIEIFDRFVDGCVRHRAGAVARLEVPPPRA